MLTYKTIVYDDAVSFVTKLFVLSCGAIYFELIAGYGIP